MHVIHVIRWVVIIIITIKHLGVLDCWLYSYLIEPNDVEDTRNTHQTYLGWRHDTGRGGRGSRCVAARGGRTRHLARWWWQVDAIGVCLLAHAVAACI